MTENLAQQEADRARDEIFACVKNQQSFVLEAAAGAGKTYSLVQTLRHLLTNIEVGSVTSPSIACITYTKVARNEIRSRIDNHPAVLCETLHSFCWQLMRNFQKELRQLATESAKWEKIRGTSDPIEKQPVHYDLGFRRVSTDRILLHHDDVVAFFVALLQKTKFRDVVRSQFPVVLIDEYQDTDSKLMNALENTLFGPAGTLPVFGLFGDHWQQIYGQGCGQVKNSFLTTIEKKVNYRSSPTLVSSFNRIRVSHQQVSANPQLIGEIRVFHCNDWEGVRQTESHWKGDLPVQEIQDHLSRVRVQLTDDGWFSNPKSVKTLMLTHRLLAAEQGYATFPEIFRRNEAFSDLEDSHLAYFVDQLEPARDYFEARRYGSMYEALGIKSPIVRSSAEKSTIRSTMQKLVEIQDSGTIGEVVDYLKSTNFPRLSPAVIKRESKLSTALDAEEPLTSSQEALTKLREAPYREVRLLARASGPSSSYSTKHGVKGAEFDDVLVVATGGWNQYNWNEMLRNSASVTALVDVKQRAAYERSRNLFYVACTRAKKRLSILFTQQLDAQAIVTLKHWFGTDNVTSAP